MEEQVLRKMRENGVFNKLDAMFLSKVSEEGQHSNVSALKPYKRIPKTQPYVIAAHLVMEFLLSFEFNYTVETVNKESNSSEEFDFDSNSDVTKPLHIRPTDAPIQVLVSEWLKDVSTPFYSNRERLGQAISRRYKNLEKEENSATKQNAAFQNDANKNKNKKQQNIPRNYLMNERVEKEKEKEKEKEIKFSPPKQDKTKYEYKASLAPPRSQQTTQKQAKPSAQVFAHDSDSILNISTDSFVKPLQQKANPQKYADPKPRKSSFQYKAPTTNKRTYVQMSTGSFDDDIGDSL